MWTRNAVACSSSSPPPLLSPTQQARLQRALAHGRRRGSVQQLAKECGLSRDVVLEWMKHNQSRAEELRFIHGDKEVDQETRRFNKPSSRGDVSTGSARKDANRGSLPPWHVRGKDRNVNATALKTLESVFQEDRFPNDDVIRGISDVTRLPKQRIIQWFREKRREVAMNKRVPKERRFEQNESQEAGEDADPTDAV
eukprot:scaffold1368_cov333-Pavlova_lutheri.AAC.30